MNTEMKFSAFMSTICIIVCSESLIRVGYSIYPIIIICLNLLSLFLIFIDKKLKQNEHPNN